MWKQIRPALLSFAVIALLVGATLLSRSEAAPVSVPVSASTWTANKVALSWVQNGTDAGAGYDFLVTVTYTGPDGTQRGIETVRIKGDGSAAYNGAGQVIASPVSPTTMGFFYNTAAQLDTIITNAANAGKLNPR